MEELPLSGGRVTKGVVRLGDTVLRPRQPNSEFVRTLLTSLHERGFDGAPRHLGTDENGRERFSFIPGEVPAELDPALSDDVIAAAAALIRRFHEASGGRVCHNDLSPCNFVFRDGVPVGIIDFDAAAPGSRLQDVGYAIFLWLNLGTDGPAAGEQARRIRVFCTAYGIEADSRTLAGVIAAVTANIERLEAARRTRDAEWWRRQLDWLREHRAELAGTL